MVRTKGPFGSTLVGVLDFLHELGENTPELLLIAAHQHCVLECVLAELMDFFEVFLQHFQFFDARYDFSGRRAPYGIWDGSSAHDSI